VAAGKPSTKEITDEILSEHGIKTARCRFTDKGNKEYVFKPFDNLIHEFIKRIYCFACSNNVNECFVAVNQRRERHTVNYEDLFYFLDQVHQHIVGDYNLLGKDSCG